ncbi:Tubulin alpha chain [Echinococcus granulosus]|uniref:Tubulin alpha chain n=1 Tax=Echinococcus granulosus TaxID=6210 RepID=W6V2E6_ECHGR|nr:Tubulin alpha chain [Echinococcus granulosus]EUB60089.1 Tubulin alpha chain [Echinococcus granulosus]
MHGLLTIHLGQCGVQIGNAVWELLACEHGIGVDGKLYSTLNSALGCDRPEQGEDIGVFFSESRQRYYPRAIMVDLEPTVIDEIRVGAYKKLWKASNLLTGKEDAANNYARAYINVGKKMLGPLMEQVRITAERCDGLAGFNVVHSLAGGTGSGLTALLLECLFEEYVKKARFSTTIYPSKICSQSTVDPYNTLLSMKATMDTLDCSLLMDNKAITDRCVAQMLIEKPTYTTLNRFVAMLVSSIYLSHRFAFMGNQHADVLELLTNIIPYPRIRFPIVGTTPLYAKANQHHEVISVPTITRRVFSQEAITLDCNIEKRYFISVALLYRGVASTGEVVAALRDVRYNPEFAIAEGFLDWCPNKFKVGVTPFPPVTVPTCAMAAAPTSVCMIAGNIAVSDAFKSTVDNFDMLFKKCAFIHWFVCEGLEEAELKEARDELCGLINEYVNLVDRDASAEACPEQTTESEDGGCPMVFTNTTTPTMRGATVAPQRPPEHLHINMRMRERIPGPSTPCQPILNGPCAGRGFPNPYSPRPILSINMSNTRPRNRIRSERPLVAYRGRSVAPPSPGMFEEIEQGCPYGFFNIFNQQQAETEEFPPWTINACHQGFKGRLTAAAQMIY